MNDKAKIQLLSMFLAACVIFIAVLAYFLWDIKNNGGEQHSAMPALSSQAMPKPWPKDWDPWNDQWDSFEHFTDMQKQMDEMMNRMLPGGSIFSQRGFGLANNSPKVTMQETEEAFEVLVTIPEGQDVELKTDLSEGVLKISGKVKNKLEDHASGLLKKTQSISQFSQSLTLLTPVDEAALTVDRNGREIVIRVPKINS
jgi:HSP20 family molecular chaperone IbpA